MKKLPVFILFSALSIAGFAQKPKNFFLNGVAKIMTGQSDSAIQYLTAAIIRETGNFQYYLRRGEAYYISGNYADAVKDFEIANDLKTGNANLWLAKSYASQGLDSIAIYYLENHLKSALRLPEKTIKTDNAFSLLKNTDAWFQLWQQEWYTEEEKLEDDVAYLVKNNNYIEAITLIDKKISESTMPVPLYIYKAEIASKQGNFRASAMDWSEVLKIRNNDLYALKQRGTAFLNAGRYKESVSDFSKAIRLDPADFELYLLRAKASKGLKDWNSAIKDVVLYLEFFPEDAQAVFACGELNYESGNYVEALKYFNRNLRTDNSKPEFFKARGKTYYQTRMYRYAIDDLSMSLDLKPSDGEVYYFKGLARFYSGDKAGACNDWKTAGKLGEPRAVEHILKNCQ